MDIKLFFHLFDSPNNLSVIILVLQAEHSENVCVKCTSRQWV